MHPPCCDIRSKEDDDFCHCVPKQNFFMTFSLKSFVVSIIFAKFVGNNQKQDASRLNSVIASLIPRRALMKRIIL